MRSVKSDLTIGLALLLFAGGSGSGFSAEPTAEQLDSLKRLGATYSPDVYRTVVASRVTMRQMKIRDEELVKLLDVVKQLPSIECIQIEDAQVGDHGFDSLRQCPHVKRLILVKTMISDAILEGILGAKGIERLHLIDCSVSADGIRKISRMGQLQALELDGCSDLEGGDFAVLGNLKELRFLNLSSTNATDDDCESFVNHPHLEEIRLSDTAVTDTALDKLATCENLKTIDLSGTTIDAMAIERFRRAKKGVIVIGPD